MAVLLERRRRSFSSWFFRFTTKRIVVYLSVLTMTVGWALVCYAAGQVPANDTDVHFAFLGLIIGGFLSFMGIFAGISKWVAEPAARKVMSEHTRMGALAHPELMARPEYDSKHEELMREVRQIGLAVAEMSGRAGGMTHSREGGAT